MAGPSLMPFLQSENVYLARKKRSYFTESFIEGKNLPHQPFVSKEIYHNPQNMKYSNELKLALKNMY